MNFFNRFKLLLTAVFIAAVVAIIAIPGSQAYDQTVTCTDSSCSGLNNSLFNELKMLPGGSVTKSIELVNQHSDTLVFSLDASKDTGTNSDFIKLVDVTVKIDTTKTKFTGTLEDFFTTNIDLEKLNSGQKRVVDITLSLQNVGNEYQGQQAKFSFDLFINQETAGVGGAAAASPSPSPLTALTGFPGLVAGAQTFLESVLGTSTPSAGLNFAGEVAGCENFNWWWPLLIQLLLSAGYLSLIHKIYFLRLVGFVVLILLALISQLVHTQLGCPCDNRFCSWYWLVNLFILAVSGIGLVIFPKTQVK